VDSTLPEEVKGKSNRRLDAAIDEVKQKEPDKQSTAFNLKRMAETLEEASKSSDAGREVWGEVKPILQRLLGWLNVEATFFGF
jgi:hypothetical protein